MTVVRCLVSKGRSEGSRCGTSSLKIFSGPLTPMVEKYRDKTFFYLHKAVGNTVSSISPVYHVL